MKRLALGVLASAAAVALVTAAIALIERAVPVISLGALYLFAVLPIAVVWGLELAIAVSIASMLAFNWFLLPPTHTFQLRDGANWLALAVFLATAVVVSALAAHARRRRDDAEQRRREADVLAEAAGDLLRGTELSAELEKLAQLTAGVLGVRAARIELGAQPRGVPIEVNRRRVATLFADEPLDPAVARRFLPALAGLLAVAAGRAELEAEALEAEALRRTDVVKTALLRSVSHDLRSPLTAIRAGAEALGSEELQLDEVDRVALVAAIRQEAERLDRVVANLLDASRLEAGAVESHRELWSVEELVGQALDSVRADAGRIIVDLAADLPPVNVDAGQVERAIANLISNALRFSPPGSPVVVRVEQGATELRIHVVDRGPGIAADERGAIFQPFHRGEGGGSGLGLAIARGFAEANGGRLWTQEDPIGGHFVLALAAAPRPAVRA
jgi:two-component system, OmpR family, sensor histidine kinase KdpD